MTDKDTGLNVWQMTTNHNRMIDLQADTSPNKDGPVEVAFFGSSAFRITSPKGVSVMIDPWRNHPSRTWDWYFKDFPITAVDIGCSTHAHFDHDALHRLDAHVLLDRLIGMYTFGDMTIYGLADKHAVDSSCAIYDFKKVHKHFQGTDVEPPNNPRSWDHCLIVVETGGMRIVHWGDNRHNPPDDIWKALGHIDIALLPVDASQHVMGHKHVQAIVDRLQPRIVVPHHYYIWDVVQRQSTLQTCDDWVNEQDVVERIAGSKRIYRIEDMDKLEAAVHYFGDNVAFDKEAWMAGS
ncbi:MAG: MBL fold metallo-hydrolase [Alphaproteobacteria bacterium]|jgi:L-ascorbate metabolism protein UlaG (beta-lactamase superfamily)|nr:MBL fold metallo-hydrolase [Alphaproteobacteria bacterium]